MNVFKTYLLSSTTPSVIGAALRTDDDRASDMARTIRMALMLALSTAHSARTRTHSAQGAE